MGRTNQYVFLHSRKKSISHVEIWGHWFKSRKSDGPCEKLFCGEIFIWTLFLEVEKTPKISNQSPRKEKTHAKNQKRSIIYFSHFPDLLHLAMPASAPAEQPVQLKLASFKIGSGWFVMGGIMADIFKKSLPPGSTVDALPKSGGIGNPKLLDLKKADLGFAFPITANWAGMEFTVTIRRSGISGRLQGGWIATGF